MEIRSSHMQCPDPLTSHPCPCSICGETFQPPDDLIFVCPKCKAALVGHCPECRGKYDDVVMDWGVDVDADDPYFWVIACCCGYELKSRPCTHIEMDEVGQQLHMQYLSLPTYEE